MKKKIVIVTYSLHKGGTEKITALIANILAGGNFEVNLILFVGDHIAYELDAAIKIIDLKCENSKKGILKLYVELNKLRADFVFSTLTVTNVIVSLIKPFVFWKSKFYLRESTILSVNNRQMKLSWLINTLIVLLYRNFDLIISQSEAMTRDLVKNYHLPHSMIVKINNPVAVNDLPLADGPHNKIPIFITVGNLRPEKGYDRMIKLLSQYKGDFIYYILGEGKMRKSLELLIEKYELENKVKLLGRVEDVGAYLNKADIYLQTSYYEGFPNAILEANASGVAALAVNSPGGTSEIVLNGVNGYLIEDFDEQSFLEHLDILLKNPLDRKKIREFILQRFSMDSFVRNINQLFS